MITLAPELLADLTAIVAYLYDDEKKSYEADYFTGQGHIFQNIERVKTFLDGLAKRGPTAREVEEGFCFVTRVHRDDLEHAGFDISELTPDDLDSIAEDMGDAYCENGFWVDLPIIAEAHKIPKKSDKKKWLVEFRRDDKVIARQHLAGLTEAQAETEAARISSLPDMPEHDEYTLEEEE